MDSPRAASYGSGRTCETSWQGKGGELVARFVSIAVFTFNHTYHQPNICVPEVHTDFAYGQLVNDLVHCTVVATQPRPQCGDVSTPRERGREGMDRSYKPVHLFRKSLALYSRSYLASTELNAVHM